MTPQQFQHQYASQTVPAQESSYQVAASHQQQDGNRIVPAERPSYRRPAGRQHPYARPSVPAPRSSYHTSAYANHGMRQAGPIRHRRNAPNSQDLNNRRLEFDQQEPSAQLHLSEDHEGYGRSPPLYDAVNSDFQKHRPSQGDFGNEHGNRPSTEHNNLEQSPEFQSVEREAGKPKEAKQKRATKAKGSKEDKKPTKSKVKGRTRFENGRLECVGDGDTRGQRWGKSSFHDECIPV